jgi:hypothetical protein
MDRRTFLQVGAGATTFGAFTALESHVDPFAAPFASSQNAGAPPAFSVIPVVGDGKWIWNSPPAGQTGYLEPRPYQLKLGIELQGRGNASQILATTPAPISCPEQTLDAEHVETQGCDAEVRDLGPDARQLFLSAPEISAGQTISATANYQLTVYKQFQNYQRDQFPEQQKIPSAVRSTSLGESPGIQTSSKEVHKLLGELRGETKHPWDLARKFAEWIPRNIRPQIGPYTGVVPALNNRLGDCAEMSAVFVALSRAANIPARLVWIPNHNWAEFYLTDKDGKGHWIPAHTACYFWFGWTGVHELVLQKGDRLRLPERGNKLFRLQEDWMQCAGRKPAVNFFAELTPLPAKEGEDPGPGARKKAANGEWKLVGSHALDRYARR